VGLPTQVQEADAVEETAVVVLRGEVDKAVANSEAAEVDLLDGAGLDPLILLEAARLIHLSQTQSKPREYRTKGKCFPHRILSAETVLGRA
jgi:hypothetical protein